MRELKVLIASWNKIFWEGLTYTVNRRPDAKVVDVCVSGQEAIDSALKNKPNVIFIDQGVKDCEFIELSHSVRNILPEASIFLVASSYCQDSVLSILKANANFYIDKEITISGLNTLLDKLHENQNFENIGFFICPYLAEQLIKETRNVITEEPEKQIDASFGLTKRELEVLSCIAQGKSNKDIAATLFISENTVKVHISKVFEKLHIKAREQAASIFNKKEKITLEHRSNPQNN
jgi:DNA-binding NarL/FixJ family response regulator